MSSSRFPGWRVVGASFIILMTTSGLAFYGLAAYLNALSNERGWSVSSISGAVALFFLVGGASGLLAARLIARFDLRVVIVGGAVCGAVALVLLGRVTEIWHVYAVYALFSIGHTHAGLVPATTVITRWFHAKRSTALSVASTGLSFGGIALTPFVKLALDHHGIEATAPWLAVVWLLGIVPVTFLAVRPDPARLGWAPDGAALAPGTSAPPPAGAEFSRAVRTPFFAAVTIAYFFVLGSQVGAIQQLVKLVDERSGATAATVATSVLAGTSVVSRLVGGQVAARVPMLRFTVVMSALQAVALSLIALAQPTWLLMAAIVLLGSTIGNLLMLHPLLIAEAFGVREYPRIFSRSQVVAFVGTAIGPYAFGWLHDEAGGYRTAYLAGAAASVIGALVLRTGRSTDAGVRDSGWAEPATASVSSP